MAVMQQAAQFIEAEMISRVPVKTGRLRNSIGIRVQGESVIIGPNMVEAPYAGYVEFGTRPHQIRPRKPGGSLVFKVGDKTVFARVVNHPGTKAQPFVMEAFQAWVDSLGQMAAEANIREFKGAYGD